MENVIAREDLNVTVLEERWSTISDTYAALGVFGNEGIAHFLDEVF